jgi:N-formylglutamate deformylase
VTGAPWTWVRGEGPLLATAIHAGHELRAEAEQLTALDAAQRRREEDPHTQAWLPMAGTAVAVHRSRWEVDLNRPRSSAVYRNPEDCWGLPPWKAPPSTDFLARSCRLYDDFYTELGAECERIVALHGAVVVLDLHSYNHRRRGPDLPEHPAGNPEINIGTESMDRVRWGRLVDRVMADLTRCGFDTRENVRFGGAKLAAWVHRRFPAAGCCLAIDVKKVFMDEHTGEVDAAMLQRLTEAFAHAGSGLREALRRG